jgi:hypothetical protein
MTKQDDKLKPVKRTTRYPPDLFEWLESERQRSGRTFNEEVINRLRVDELAKLHDEVAELKSMIREVLDHVRK